MVVIMKKLKQMLELLLLGLSSQCIMDYFKKGAVTAPKLLLQHSQKLHSLNYVLCSCTPLGVYQYTFYKGCKRMKNRIFSLCL